MQLYGGDSQSAGFGVVDGGTSTNTTPDILDGGDAITRFDPNYNGVYTQADISYFEAGYINETYFTAERFGEIALESSASLTANIGVQVVEFSAELTARSLLYGSNNYVEFLPNFGYDPSTNQAVATIIPPSGLALTDPSSRSYISVTGTLGNDFGLTTTDKHLGSGSVFLPYNLYGDNKLVINPNNPQRPNFSILAGEDFIISFWANYGYLSVDNLGARYPIMKYGGATNTFSGWEFGITVGQINGSYTPFAYFNYNGNIMTAVPNSVDYRAMGPTNNWCRWEASRSNGVLKFRFLNPDAYLDADATANIKNDVSESIGIKPDYTDPSDHSYDGIVLGGNNPSLLGYVNGAYIDEVFMAGDTNIVRNTIPVDPNVYPGQPPHDTWQIYGEIADGGLTSTRLLYHFNGNYFDDQSGIKQFSAALSSASSTTASANRVVSATARLESANTFTIIANTTERAAIQLQAVSQVSAQVVKTARTSAYLTVLSSEVIITNRDQSASANLTVTSTLTAQAIRSKNSGAINLNSQSALTAQAIRGISGQSILQTTSTINTIAIKTANLLAHLQSTSRLYEKQLVNNNIIWVIPKENRNWTIDYEYRDWTIEYEERNWIVQQET